MTRIEKALPFEASANLQRLIGRELVPTDEAALAELVKNSYDAGAKNVRITFQPPTTREPGWFEVRDDGSGMTPKDLSKLFMWAGYSERGGTNSRAKRTPTGEKGIGRFAADRLGRELDVFTKPTIDSPEVFRLRINWDDFEHPEKRFNEISADLTSTKDTEFGVKEKGTVLRITRLRDNHWPPEKLRKLRDTLAELVDPLTPPSDFEIELDVIGSTKFSGQIRHDVPSNASIDISFSVLANGKIRRRVNGKQLDDVKPTTRTEELVGLKGRFLYFLGSIPKTSARLTPAVRLYRDGFRVEPLGSPASDWLGVAEHKAARAGHAHISPKKLFGFIEISRREHRALADTTSRQALMDNEEVRALVGTLKGEILFLEEKIKTEVTEPRWLAKAEQDALEFEEARFQALGLLSMGLAHELRQPMQSILSESDIIVRRLRQLEIKDATISNSQKNIEGGIDRMNKTIEVLSDIAKADVNDVSEIDLVQVVKDALLFHQTRAATSNIDLSLRVPARQIARFNKSAIHTVLSNLVRNAIEAVEDLPDEAPRNVTVSVTKNGKKHEISVQDNGPGIPPEVQEKIFKRFTTKKTSGMGIGLSLCKATIGKFGGDVTFRTKPMKATTFTISFPDIRD